MCGRFTSYDLDDDSNITDLIEEASTLFNETKSPYKLKTKGEVFPTDVVPIITNDLKSKSFKLKCEAMYWGYPGFPSFRKPNGKPRPIINTKTETALQK
jgi:putative SOS response-associated peptidase YedK